MNVVTRAQEKLDALEALDNKALLERARKEIKALCGSEGRPKRWTMTIPVDADRDSDILFGEVLKRFEILVGNQDDLMKALFEVASFGPKIPKEFHDIAMQAIAKAKGE